jgi:hypothetical protein
VFIAVLKSFSMEKVSAYRLPIIARIVQKTIVNAASPELGCWREPRRNSISICGHLSWWGTANPMQTLE